MILDNVVFVFLSLLPFSTRSIAYMNPRYCTSSYVPPIWIRGNYYLCSTITSRNKKCSFFARTNDDNVEGGKMDTQHVVGDILDAVIISDGTERRNTNNLTMINQVTSLAKTTEGELSVFQLFMDWWKKILQSLAALSLEDYKIRSSIIKERAAGRQLEESIARIRGENPGYVRPMYADETTIGPLGIAEKTAVQWLTEVIEEEAKRAKKILEGGGEVVRPIDMITEEKKVSSKGEESPLVNGGPLAELEQKAVNFLKIVSESELYRTTEGKYCRPMDLEETKRGPLGEAEAKLVRALEDITKAEQQRMELSRQRGGEIVRPIDIPGPLGEIEKAVVSIVAAERRRSKEGQRRNNLVRPMDSSIPRNPLGDAERSLSESLERVRDEERKRLQGLQQYLENNRPMEKDPESTLGFTEAFVVAIYRGPKLILKVIERVRELLSSSPLSEEDRTNMQRRLAESKSLSSPISLDEEEDDRNNGSDASQKDSSRLP